MQYKFKATVLKLLVVWMVLLILIRVNTDNGEVQPLATNDEITVEKPQLHNIKMIEQLKYETRLLEIQINNLEEAITKQKEINSNLEDYIHELVIPKDGLVSFDANDVRKPSYALSEEIDYIVINTGLEGLGDAYVRAEKLYDINALILLAISINESGWGSNDLSIYKNNVTSYGADDGNAFENARHFETKEECILETAKLLKEQYLTENGAYFNGYGVTDINVRYASDEGWSGKIIDIAKFSLKKYLNTQE